jgi:hypothetical protein
LKERLPTLKESTGLVGDIFAPVAQQRANIQTEEIFGNAMSQYGYRVVGIDEHLLNFTKNSEEMTLTGANIWHIYVRCLKNIKY